VAEGKNAAAEERGEARPLDRIALDLQELRMSAGSPSYAELVRRIAAVRLERGVPAAAATRPRSTVYDAFATGRARLDAELLRDIVLALGESEQSADAWVRRCREARRAAETEAPARRRDRPSAEASRSAPTVETGASRAANAADPTQGHSLRTRPVPVVPSPRGAARGFEPLLLISCVLANLLGLSLASALGLQVYLDMVGTALAAVVLGPWRGAAVALASCAIAMLGTGSAVNAPFALVGCAGALIWGYGIGRLGAGRSLSSYFLLNLVVALVCSVIATPIVLLTFGDHQVHGSQQITDSLGALGLPLLASAFSSNLVTSIMDKLLTGFVVLTGLTLLHGAGTIPSERLPVIERLAALRIGGADRRLRPLALR